MIGRRIWSVFASLLAIACFAAGTWTLLRLWPDSIRRSPYPTFPRIAIRDGQIRVQQYPDGMAAEIATYPDRLSAYLDFDYLRSLVDSVDARNYRVFLTGPTDSSAPKFVIVISVPNDTLRAIPYLFSLVAKGYISGFRLRRWPESASRQAMSQTAFFDLLYSLPTQHKLETASLGQLEDITTRFLLFKSRTDPRVQGHIEPVPTVLSAQDAKQLASDILTIAKFYGLPLDVFLAIGAMENNFMDAPGDLDHIVWKRHPQRGDIVLKRRPGAVLVANSSTGVWQITRETLRLAHHLFLQDKRDYSALPPRLRPPEALELNAVTPGALTTYAGLLLRNLLDQYKGNVELAVAAYNGGTRFPNARYAERVLEIAAYVRRILEHAVASQGDSVRRA